MKPTCPVVLNVQVQAADGSSLWKMRPQNRKKQLGLHFINKISRINQIVCQIEVYTDVPGPSFRD